jgi:hypothetical protein
MTRQITFDRMKKNPSNVTMFGASHNGRSCTKPFHYIFQQSPSLQLEIPRAYVVFQDIIRYQGLVDTRIFIGFQMNQGLFGHALVRSLLYKPTELIEFPSIRGTFTWRHWSFRCCNRRRQQSTLRLRVHRKQI